MLKIIKLWCSLPYIIRGSPCKMTCIVEGPIILFQTLIVIFSLISLLKKTY